MNKKTKRFICPQYPNNAADLDKELKDVFKKVEQYVHLFENNLAGKTFLYLYSNGNNNIDFKEVMFKRENFLHLTGLDYQNRLYLKRYQNKNIGTNSMDFYTRLLNHDKTLINDVTFINAPKIDDRIKHFENAQKKIFNLNKLTNICNNAEKIGPYKGGQNFNLIINLQDCSIAFGQTPDGLVPFSSLNGDVNKCVSSYDLVNSIFSKDENADLCKIQFVNKALKLDKANFDSHLLNKLSIESFVNSDVELNATALSTIQHRYIISSIKSEMSELSQKRQQINDANVDVSLDKYINSRDNFIDHLKTYIVVEPDENKKEIANVISAHYKEQLSKANALNNADLIPEEIDEINKIGLKLSIDVDDDTFTRATAIANEIKASSAQLLKNKINNFSYLPQRHKDEMINTNLHGVQIQGDVALLRMPANKPSLNEMIQNVTSQLSEVAQRISDFLSAPLQYNAQKQPLQDHTARGRKINLSLPFPKEKPSQERTEPVTAKSEKPQKLDFKPVEHAEKKMLSWIAKEISSAKREANENNKNHEPKHHDKDQSL